MSRNAHYCRLAGYGDSAKDDTTDAPPLVQNELPDHLLGERREPSKVDLIVAY